MKSIVCAFVALIILPTVVQAGCNCESDHGHHADAMVAYAPMLAVPAIPAHVERLPAPIPPGTLGQTYQRASHPIPEGEHPRTAMLAVRDHREVKYLKTQLMGGFRMKNGIWLFETQRPLFPGQDNVVRVEARKDKNDIQPYKVKFVRLIPGRIVYLDFCQPEE